VIALAGKTLPLAIATPTQEEFAFRIEGKDNNVCVGKAVGPTALDVVKNSAEKCGFTYHIKEMSYGPYLDKINNDEASGLIGWLYLVNYLSPSVGANDYILKTGDEVLWYFGDFIWQPLKVSLSPIEITTGGETQVTIEYFNGSTWANLDNGKVYYGTTSASSDDSGKATVSPIDGYYKIFAEKENYIRSNSELLKVGAPFSQEVSLQVNVGSGTVKGEEEQAGISFTIDTGKMDFGAVAKGQAIKKNIVINNNGATPLNIKSEVSGDAVFVDYLLLDNNVWRKFTKSVGASESQTIIAGLTLPSTAKITAGLKNGKITFWAVGK
jgi:hypothetical protein